MTAENKNAAEAAEVAEVEVAEQEVAEPEQAAEVAETPEAEAEVVEQVEGEQPAKPAADKPKPAKPNPFRSRISELTAEKRALEAQVAELKKPSAEGKQEHEPPQQEQAPEGFIPVSVARNLVQQEAQRIAADNQFDRDCDSAFSKGVEAYADFEEARESFGALGGLTRDVIEDALATGAAHQVIYDLGSNPDEAARILKLPRGKRIAELTRMTIKAPAKPSVSRASPPIKPVGGNAKKDFDPLDTTISDEEWHRQEDARERERNRKRA